MLVDAVRTRLQEVGIDRVDDALSLKRLIEQNVLPPAPVTAFVLPMGLVGADVVSAGTPFIQNTKETVAVLLAIKEANPFGDKARDTLAVKIDQVVGAIAGWQAPGEPDVFTLVRATLLNFAQGVVLFQIEFSAKSQVRILP